MTETFTYLMRCYTTVIFTAMSLVIRTIDIS